MFLVSLFYFVAGAAVLVYGFKKNNRDLLAIAAFIWLTPGAMEEISSGFIEGYTDLEGGGCIYTYSTAAGLTEGTAMSSLGRQQTAQVGLLPARSGHSQR